MPKKITLSIVINTKNAVNTIKDTLNSVKKIADEIVVVDMHSTDKTREVVKKYGVKVFLHEDLGFADPARNFALAQATSDWILVLDADEKISPSLADKILKIINDKTSARSYSLPRKNIIFGKWIQYSNWWPDYQLRLFRKGEVEWTNQVHELAKSKSEINFLPAEVDLAIIHHNYQNVEQFVERLNRYTTLEVKKRIKIDKLDSSHILKSFFDEFLKKAFKYQGVKDASHGVALALLQASYELVAFLKTHEKQLNNELIAGSESAQPTGGKKAIKAIRDFQKDLNYWIADYNIKESTGLKKIYWQVRRKFKI